MSPERRKGALFYLCLLLGSTDALTGVLLMLLPVWTLKMMWVPSVSPDAVVFIRYIGAFVFSVGGLYIFALLSVLFVLGRARAIRSILLTTAWVRMIIFLFTAVALLSGQLGLAWISVPLFDGMLAGVQLWLVFGWDN